jgi:hypothetical protein
MAAVLALAVGVGLAAVYALVLVASREIRVADLTWIRRALSRTRSS